MVRPFGKSNLTEIKTELKLLQIDLVLIFLTYLESNILYCFLFQDEKYQELVTTAWLEMVNFSTEKILLFLFYNYEQKRSGKMTEFVGTQKITVESKKSL